MNTLQERIQWMERVLRNNFGRSHNLYKIFIELVQENEKLKEKPKNKKLTKEVTNG